MGPNGNDSKTQQKEVASEQQDRFRRIKFMAYCMSNRPPDGFAFSYTDFLRIAKYQLSREKGLLMKDPVWDRYNDEEILIEYYCMLFDKNPELKAEFEGSIVSEDAEFMDWVDAEKRKTKEQLSGGEKAKEPVKIEEFDFDPKLMGEED